MRQQDVDLAAAAMRDAPYEHRVRSALESCLRGHVASAAAGGVATSPAGAEAQRQQQSARHVLHYMRQLRVGLDAHDDDDVTPLQVAAAAGNFHLVRLLIEEGADLEQASGAGLTALLHACYNGHEEVVVELILKGADPTARTYLGASALTLSCRSGNERLVRRLLDMNIYGHELSPNAMRPADGTMAAPHMSPLAAAVFNNHTAIVQLLLTKGAEPDLGVPQLALTPLMLAALFSTTDVSQKLLDHGADANELSVDRLTAYDLAGRRHGSPTVRRQLRSLLEPVTAMQRRASRLPSTVGIIDAIQGLRSVDDILREGDGGGDDTPGALAVRKSDELAVKHIQELLQRDPSLVHYIEADNGSTPLMHAAIKGRVDIVSKLIVNGAELDARDNCEGWTALMQAIFHGQWKVATMLLQSGASATVKSADGQTTALDLACLIDDAPKELLSLLAKKSAPHYAASASKRQTRKSKFGHSLRKLFGTGARHDPMLTSVTQQRHSTTLWGRMRHGLRLGQRRLRGRVHNGNGDKHAGADGYRRSPTPRMPFSFSYAPHSNDLFPDPTKKFGATPDEVFAPFDDSQRASQRKAKGSRRTREDSLTTSKQFAAQLTQLIGKGKSTGNGRDIAGSTSARQAYVYDNRQQSRNGYEQPVAHVRFASVNSDAASINGGGQHSDLGASGASAALHQANTEHMVDEAGYYKVPKFSVLWNDQGVQLPDGSRAEQMAFLMGGIRLEDRDRTRAQLDAAGATLPRIAVEQRSAAASFNAAISHNHSGASSGGDRKSAAGRVTLHVPSARPSIGQRRRPSPLYVPSADCVDVTAGGGDLYRPASCYDGLRPSADGAHMVTASNSALLAATASQGGTMPRRRRPSRTVQQRSEGPAPSLSTRPASLHAMQQQQQQSPLSASERQSASALNKIAFETSHRWAPSGQSALLRPGSGSVSSTSASVAVSPPDTPTSKVPPTGGIDAFATSTRPTHRHRLNSASITSGSSMGGGSASQQSTTARHHHEAVKALPVMHEGDLAALLQKYDLLDYACVLAEQEIDFESFVNLSAEDLDELNIDEAGRHKIEHALAALADR